jgi:hypothetical protein
MAPTIIHPRENTTGSALYLNPSPVRGDGVYLNPTGGMIGIPNIVTKILEFGDKHSGLIKDGVTSIAQAASAIGDLKRASDDARKLAEITKIRKEKQVALTDQERALIEDAIKSVKEGSGLKRF